MTYNFNEFVQYIKEGLIKTYDIDFTIERIKNTIKNYNISFIINKNTNNTFSIKFENIYTTRNIVEIIEISISELFNLFGWFPSKMEMENIYAMKNIKNFDINEIKMYFKNLISIEITFESKFDVKITNIPKKLFHLTIQDYENNILKYGLLPKYKSKLTTHDYDGRIYLCDSINKCKSLINKMNLFYKEEMYDILSDIKNKNKIYNKNTDWIIFEIDSEKAEIDKLYIDPNFIGGYYYLNNIKREALKIVDKE